MVHVYASIFIRWYYLLQKKIGDILLDFAFLDNILASNSLVGEFNVNTVRNGKDLFKDKMIMFWKAAEPFKFKLI